MRTLAGLSWGAWLLACTGGARPVEAQPSAAKRDEEAALPGGAPEQGATQEDAEALEAAALEGCALERLQLERAMARALQQAALDPSITSTPDFTLALETATGQRFVHAQGSSSLRTRYESASTSKWVAAAVILDVVERGLLSLDAEPSDWLPYWQEPGVTLAHLLSFTSGFSREPLCINLPNASFAGCVQRAYELNAGAAPPPGTVFDYSSTHLQVAGLMALQASGLSSWAELFADWQARSGLFPTGAFDLSSLDNPRLAGGMTWSGVEYLAFLRAIQAGTLLGAELLAASLENQRGAATADASGSPVLAALGQDWAYGFGNWLECESALGPGSFDCGPHGRNSSPGAYGAYPFVDFEHGYVGILARQGALGTFREGVATFAEVAQLAARWAEVCASD